MGFGSLCGSFRPSVYVVFWCSSHSLSTHSLPVSRSLSPGRGRRPLSRSTTLFLLLPSVLCPMRETRDQFEIPGGRGGGGRRRGDSRTFLFHPVHGTSDNQTYRVAFFPSPAGLFFASQKRFFSRPTSQLVGSLFIHKSLLGLHVVVSE